MPEHREGDGHPLPLTHGSFALALEARLVAFERDMPSRYRWADVALCRAGALTVAELSLAGLLHHYLVEQ